MRDFTDRRERGPRFAADRFVPVVFREEGKHVQVGGRLVDISVKGARMVAAVHGTAEPGADLNGQLVFARSDVNRHLDLDGLELGVRVVHVRNHAETQVIRMAFTHPVPGRIRRWLKRLSTQQIATQDVDDIPDHDPDVWAGWAAAPSAG